MKYRALIRFSLLCLSLSSLIGCGQEAPAPTQSAPATATPAPVEQSSPAASGKIGKIAPGTVRFHYQRKGGDYDGWGVYAWKGVRDTPPDWPANTAFEQKDAFGVYADVAVAGDAAMMDFLITNGSGRKDCATDQSVTFPPTIMQRGAQVWVQSGDCKVYTEQP